MRLDLILPISFMMGTISYFLIAKWYVMPWARQRSLTEAITPILLLHSFRYIGMTFLIEGVTTKALDPRFADPAAYGDLLAAALALVALFALRYSWKAAIPLVWIFNIEGTVDLLNAVGRGIMFNTDGHMGATFFIPIVIVPVLLVTHGIVFLLLMKRN